jgi:hypothetical protein
VFCGQERAAGDNEETCESLCPSDLPRLVRDEILSELKLHDRDAPLFSVVGDGEVRGIAGDVGLITPHDEVSLFAQEVYERFCKAFVPVGKNTDVPRAKHL